MIYRDYRPAHAIARHLAGYQRPDPQHTDSVPLFQLGSLRSHDAARPSLEYPVARRLLMTRIADSDR